MTPNQKSTTEIKASVEKIITRLEKELEQRRLKCETNPSTWNTKQFNITEGLLQKWTQVRNNYKP